MKSMIYVAILITIVGCGRDVRPDLPPPAPEIVEVVVPHYVPIPDSLLSPCRWRRSAPLEVIPQVARERRKCLEQYEADREAIRRVRGGPVPDPTES